MKDGFGLITGVNSDPDVEALRDTLVRQKQPKCKGELTSASDVRTLAGTAITVKRVNVTCTDVGNGDDVTEVFSFYPHRSEEHTSELQSLMRISYAVFYLKTTKTFISTNNATFTENSKHRTTTTYNEQTPIT